ncbi:MAG: HlyD family secretion protein [Nostoc indistinguendum CM1-VF10]|jgi:HlyD family secretion protein|nr:HlyD family secretion protein [Nostoc indistinguendum CM1-VF10]
MVLNTSDSSSDLLPSVQTDEFLPPITRWLTLGDSFLVVTVGTAILLGTVFKYNVTIKAPATVRPTGETRVVQAATEGTVKSILVRENQSVKQRQVVATLDSSRLQTQRKQLQDNIQAFYKKLEQTSNQLRVIDNQIAAETDFMKRTVISAQADLQRSQRDFKEQQITVNTDVEEAEIALELARVELKQYQRLTHTGAVAKLQIKEKEQAFKAAQIKLKRAKAALNPSVAPVIIAKEQISQQRAKGKSTLATLNKNREDLLQQRVELQNQRSYASRELQQVGIELDKSVLRSPTDGVILNLALRNLGQTVGTGEAIAQVTPAHTPLVIKALVATQDIGKVALGQTVKLQISAYPYPDYGTLEGTVSAIAPDTVAQPQGTITGAATSYYQVTIQPEKSYLVMGDRQYPIQSGMEARADIISRRETVLRFILRKIRLITDF